MNALRIAPLVACYTLVATAVQGGLVVHYPLEEASGVVAADLVGGRNGTVQNSGAWLNPGLGFDGTQFVTTPADAGNVGGGAATVALWVNMDDAWNGQYLVDKGIFSLFISQHELSGEFNRGGSSSSGGSPYSTFVVKAGLPTGSWHHVAFTIDGTTLKTYFDGVKTDERARSVTFGTTSHGLRLGQRVNGTFNFRGGLRDVRVYDSVLTEAEISQVASALPSSYRGLWLGRAALDEVRDARSGQWGSAPEFAQTVLMHVDESGVASLLREAIVMQTRVTAPDVPEQVVVVDPAQVSNYDGITLRGGKRIGQRFSSATMPLPGGATPLVKQGVTFEASISLPVAHPLNPFRHKFHPDLAGGRDISRTVQIELTDGDSPADNVMGGILSETVGGLHKDPPLCARGPVTFTRVSSSGLLGE